MVLKVFFVIYFHLVFVPTTLASLPPGVMLLNRSTALTDSATDIEKMPKKSAPERERCNRSVVKMTDRHFMCNMTYPLKYPKSFARKICKISYEIFSTLHIFFLEILLTFS